MHACMHESKQTNEGMTFVAILSPESGKDNVSSVIITELKRCSAFACGSVRVKLLYF